MEEVFPRQWLFFEKFPAIVRGLSALASAANGCAGDPNATEWTVTRANLGQLGEKR